MSFTVILCHTYALSYIYLSYICSGTGGHKESIRIKAPFFISCPSKSTFFGIHLLSLWLGWCDQRYYCSIKLWIPSCLRIYLYPRHHNIGFSSHWFPDVIMQLALFRSTVLFLYLSSLHQCTTQRQISFRSVVLGPLENKHKGHMFSNILP